MRSPDATQPLSRQHSTVWRPDRRRVLGWGHERRSPAEQMDGSYVPLKMSCQAGTD
jgi:hypothetical protein